MRAVALGYTYDLTGRRISMALPWGLDQQYAYDPATGELASLTASSGDIFTRGNEPDRMACFVMLPSQHGT